MQYETMNYCHVVAAYGKLCSYVGCVQPMHHALRDQR